QPRQIGCRRRDPLEESSALSRSFRLLDFGQEREVIGLAEEGLGKVAGKRSELGRNSAWIFLGNKRERGCTPGRNQWCGRYRRQRRGLRRSRLRIVGQELAVGGRLRWTVGGELLR